jgi:hypothetical protein
MNKFGTLKSKILHKLTEAYANGKKDEIKDILRSMKENKEFLSMYLFYEEIENKNIENKEHAELFVEEIIPLLRKQSSDISKFTRALDKKIGDVTADKNEIYSHLDILCENDTLKNVDKKIIAKKKLVEHLLKNKEIVEPISSTIIENTTLLHTILTNNFNVLYSNTLNENDKKQLIEILSISDEDLKTNFGTLKEEVTEKMDKMLIEEKNDDLKQKLIMALTEAKEMNASKYNYYKLQILKSGL